MTTSPQRLGVDSVGRCSHRPYTGYGSHHRFPGNFMTILSYSFSNEKSPCFPVWGNKDRKSISAVPPCLLISQPLCPVPTHRLPVNAGIASEDTLPSGISHCPRRPIVPNRLSLRSQLCGTLCGCASGFTPASKVYTMLCSLYLRCVRLSRTILRLRRTKA